MPIINVTVKNKIAQNPTKELVCGNSDYVIYFDFDEEWSAHAVKTARFSFNSTFIDVVFEGNSVNVPVITNAFTCAVGVYAGDLQTTTPAIIKCQKSILCADGSPADPLPDVYNQIVELCNETVETARNVEERANNGEFNGVKGDKGDKGDPGKDAVTDQTYSPESPNAQSGVAVSQALKTLKTTDGTVVSQNADFAEVAEWADGNPNNEDRTGYFVCANVPVDGIVMKKATSLDDVKGVTILAPAFAGNYTKDKLDRNGNLLPKYSYVAIIGFVPVIDNGTCTVGGRCMPDDNGCAIPSSNSMGYQVVNRIDENRVLIIIEPNGDMVQRIKTKVNKLEEDVDNLAPDQTYNPESENAQSGVAVAEALAGFSGGSSGTWEKIVDITTTEEVNGIIATVEEFPKLAQCKEIVVRIVYPKSPTNSKITLGAARIDCNSKTQVIFRFSGTTVDTTVVEQRCHCFLADDLIYSTGTDTSTGVSAVTGYVKAIVGERRAKKFNDISYTLNEATVLMPIGTQIVVYGKVEG